MTPARGGGWDTGKVPLEICPDPSAHNSTHNLDTPQPEAGLDAAWAEAEAALPEGWRFHGLSPIGDRWHAIALGGHTDQKCDQGVIHQEYANATAMEATPAAALLALAAALREPKP